ncbi:glycosyltransferase family 4 protein [[Clostridium] polysaccharolyticum]|uniref:Glycosyltransferase involved in cell wall bisynthesis n=1 Tax=[Clostridium] polysaccharolyticum TaxID=29364 RepID=A0A1H9ZCA1_9FIRM|nr:glycosyltransferase family 4 protein [[Clostridium] polysaccharolyticum]SES79170.1 Glycosyltransferase involved in cell wall bisynthesis [[Clostridium] polysaccharolyticum]
MKVLIVTYGILPVPAVHGGAVETLTQFLIDENEKDHKIDFVVSTIYDKEVKQASKAYKNTSFVYSYTRRFYDLLVFLNRCIRKLTRKHTKLIEKSYLRKVRKYAKNNSIDYILIENCTDFVMPLSDLKIPMILHLHNDYLNADTPNAQKIADSCRAIITVSDFITKRVKTIEKTSEKTFTLLNSVNLSLFGREKYSKFRADYRREHGIKDDDIVIIFAGRLHETKGILELIQAFNKLKKRAYLLLVGGSWYGVNRKTRYVENVLSEIQNNERIILTGYINFKDMPKYYAIGDICAFPSVWEEPAGLVPLEAQASGLALLATDRGGINENCPADSGCLISFEHNEELVSKLSEQLNILCSDAEKRKDNVESGKRFVKDRGRERYLCDFMQILNKIIEM